MGGMITLAALALTGMQAGASAPACGCGQFALDAIPAASSQAVLSAEARVLRDFALFFHRRIGADLIRKQGPYLQTVAAYFPHCANDTVKLAWLRQTLASAGDTRLFAERLAQQYDAGRTCSVPNP
ncbi:hypothetical protein IV454_12095 [Massilia antarctica]|uniref:Rap1a immunity protein domain-containing protein n=1 Tax=Massilia antarctica TaxID=2765360 RepID=A0AA48WI39_9BURK|nr:hypothetical protein [Massilia antarctica]QPI52168.1 hypothetical protein IV454_12095 [Massilia antarctica]